MIMFVSSHYLLVILLYFSCQYNYYLFFMTLFLLQIGSRWHHQSLITWSVLILSSLTLLSHAIFHIVLAIEGDQWSTADTQWAQLIGFIRFCFGFKFCLW